MVQLQRASSEVQERASTLRHLLAEMEILPMNWETEAEEIHPSEAMIGVKNNKKGLIKAAIKEMKLLDEVDDLLDMPGTGTKIDLSANKKDLFTPINNLTFTSLLFQSTPSRVSKQWTIGVARWPSEGPECWLQQ